MYPYPTTEKPISLDNLATFTEKHVEIKYAIIDLSEGSNGMLLNINIFIVSMTVEKFSFPCLLNLKH